MSESPIQVNAALGGPWELLGILIQVAGGEDASGHRRFLADHLTNNDYERFKRSIPIYKSQFDELRKMTTLLAAALEMLQLLKDINAERDKTMDYDEMYEECQEQYDRAKELIARVEQ